MADWGHAVAPDWGHAMEIRSLVATGSRTGQPHKEETWLAKLRISLERLSRILKSITGCHHYFIIIFPCVQDKLSIPCFTTNFLIIPGHRPEVWPDFDSYSLDLAVRADGEKEAVGKHYVEHHGWPAVAAEGLASRAAADM